MNFKRFSEIYVKKVGLKSIKHVQLVDSFSSL